MLPMLEGLTLQLLPECQSHGQMKFAIFAVPLTSVCSLNESLR